MQGKHKLLRLVDSTISLLLITLLLGATLAFGGGVAWAKPALATVASLLVLGLSIRMTVSGSWAVLKSPLTGLGVLGIGLALVQIAPLPASLAKRVSPRSAEVYATGILSTPGLSDDPEMDRNDAASSRSPVSLNRSATLRWVWGAMICLSVFWGVSHYTDRQNRLFLVWGTILAALGINSILIVIQLATGSNGLYGFVQPGGGRLWDPSHADILAAPGTSVLRTLGENSVDGSSAWVVARPDRSFLLGTTFGGSGAFLGLAALALPLAIALVLQLISPRGSRESFLSRLRTQGHSTLVVMLLALIVVSSTLAGIFAARWFILPIACSVAIVGFGSSLIHGLRLMGLCVTVIALLSLMVGVVLGGAPWIEARTRPLTDPINLSEMKNTWASTSRIIRDYPVMGVGLGGFSAIEPFYKRQDASWSTASSSLLQWAAETGLPGISLLLLGFLWVLWRLPGSMSRVGTADRSLAFGMVGAAVGFGVFSVVHWTFELPSLAISASAIAGTWNRWLAGGTDLFVELS